MNRILAAAALVAVFALGACSVAPAVVTPSPSVAPSPTAPGTPAPSPTAEPVPTQPPSQPEVTPKPTDAPITEAEQYLIDGVQRDELDCRPVRDQLPDGAIAGIECDSDHAVVARVGFYLFENDDDMLAAYIDRMTTEGVALDSGDCRDGEHEGPYVPGEQMDTIPSRHGCFINDAGFANYRATLPGGHVYVGVLGRTDDMNALEDFAWIGNLDTPGSPTLWYVPG